MKKYYFKLSIATFLLAIFGILAFFHEKEEIYQSNEKKKLLGPAFNDVTLFKAYKGRKTSRKYNEKSIPIQILSNLLWAANGINRPESGKRTAPSAYNMHLIDLYVATADGLYLYKAQDSTLIMISEKDVRKETSLQIFDNNAPVIMIFVADYSKTKKISKYEKEIFASVEAGAISQNIYLYCSSEGLATGVRGSINKSNLSKLLKLSKKQGILLAQSVGYPHQKNIN